MSETQVERQGPEASVDETAALFAQLVMQQSNMALMLMGKVAHPQSGEVMKDIDGARFFIDQLEMLESKTKGNLNRDESALLKQTLMTLRLAFVEAVESPQPSAPSQTEQRASAQPADRSEEKPTAEASAGAEEEQHRKKFSKKY
jgi:hypothetical protein